MNFNLTNGKVYIAGINGMVGSALARKLSALGIEHKGHDSKILDLRNFENTLDALRDYQPNILVIAAAKVGGILANNQDPVGFLNDNLRIQLSLFQAANQLKIEKVLFLGSSCIYPKNSSQPIKEEYLMSGELEVTNKSYALAKIVGIQQVQSYRTMFRRRWISVMPTNLYGPNDNFENESSHVIPGLINRMHNAKIQDLDVVEVWGSGRPLREFLYVEDLADAIIFVLSNYDSESHLNIGSPFEISIYELVYKIKEIVGFEGQIIWNNNYPDGTLRKKLDTAKLDSLGWHATTNLENGLELTYSWYKKRFAT